MPHFEYFMPIIRPVDDPQTEMTKLKSLSLEPCFDYMAHVVLSPVQAIAA